jgi:integrase
MAQTINFKKEALDALWGLEKQYEVVDAKNRGLRLMVNPGGSKTFYLYRKVKGQPQRIKIGRYPDLAIEQARAEAKRLGSIITLGGSPQEEKIAARQELTFKELFEHYYTEHAQKHTKRPLDNKKMIDYHIMPKIGRLKVRAITAEKIRAIHSEMGDESGTAGANRVIQIVSAVFNFGIKQSYIKVANPCFGLKKFKTLSRDRFLNKSELIGFFEALKVESQMFQDYFSLLLYTGARKSNVLSMKWEDIDFDLNRWRIPADQTKNQEVNIVPLAKDALHILQRLQKKNDLLTKPLPYVFPSNGKSGHLQDPKRCFDRIKTKMDVSDIRIHDLRRTLGSYMAIGGASLPIIGKALNHKSREATAIYARLSENPVLEAMDNAVGLMLQK